MTDDKQKVINEIDNDVANITESEKESELPLVDIEQDEFSDDWGDEDEIIDDEEDDDLDLDGYELPDGFEDVVKQIEKVDSEDEPADAPQDDSIVDLIGAKDAQKDNQGSEIKEGWFVGDKADSQSDLDGEQGVEQEEQPQDDIPEEEIVDDETINERYSELESVRESTEGIDSGFADLSYLEEIKKKVEPQEMTAEQKKSAKAKQLEEKKRKRKEENDLFARRYKAKSINAAVAQSNPIIYFYNAVLDKKGNTKLFNVYQVLQDRFLGKLVPQLWTAVAESTDRVLDLNIANLVEQLKICEQYPDYEFILSMSTRFFTKPAVLEKMIATIEKPVPNLVMAFDCVSLQNLGTAAKTGLGQIKSKGIKIILDNTEKVSMTTLSELEFDYLRIDSRYYELGNFKSEGFLRLLTGWAQELGIPTIATFCDHPDMVEYMLYMGIDLVQGNAVSRPMRTVPNAVKAITPVESMLDDGTNDAN